MNIESSSNGGTLRNIGAVVLTILLVSLSNAKNVTAAESGSALYIGGSVAFGAGVTPPPGTYLTFGGLFYDGKVRAVILDGLISLNVRKTAYANVANVMYVLPSGLAGGRLAISASLPFASFADLHASAAGAVVGRLKTSGWGLGDLSVKVQNGWTYGGFSHTASITAWLPTGRYDPGFSPNAGKNHIGFDFSWAFTQFWKGTNIELSGAFGLSVELENPTTNYRNGNTAHAEVALGYRTKSGLTIGAAGYAIKQLTGDRGRGATLGPFKREVYALGPALSYSGLIGGIPVSISARHYRELKAVNTFKGHISFVTITGKF